MSIRNSQCGIQNYSGFETLSHLKN